MGLIELDNQTNTPLDLSLVETITAAHTQKMVELLIVDTQTMQSINLEYRAVDKPTDVLSFPLEDGAHLPLGSIVICDAYLHQGAQAFAHTIQDEFVLLYIHGLLHLLGLDHESDNGEMREKEAALIAEYALPKSLIVRTLGDDGV